MAIREVLSRANLNGDDIDTVVMGQVVQAGAKMNPARQAAMAAGGTLNIGLHIPLSTLDWQSTVSHPLPHVMGHVFEGLFGFGRDFNAASGWCERNSATVSARVP